MIYCRGGVFVAITPAIAIAAILFFCGLGVVFVKLIQGVSEKSRVFCDFLEAFNLLDKQVLLRFCGGLRVSSAILPRGERSRRAASGGLKGL